MNVILKQETIKDSYSALIADGQGKGQKFFDAIQLYLKNSNLPNVSYEIVQVAPARFAGRGRDYILVKHENLREYQMYISAQDFGNYLNVTWALTLEPGMFNRKLSTIDIFVQQELDAYTTVVHRAVVDTVKEFYAGLNQDFTLVNMRSRSGLTAW
jgi:hypothetical protein